MIKTYTIEELQKVLQVGRNKAYELVRTGKIKSVRVGKQIRIPEKYLDEFLTN